jgi:hypothetical protein
MLIRSIVATRMEAQAPPWLMQRNAATRKYASANVPSIGCDIAKSRRAASCDPAGATGRTGLGSDCSSERGSSESGLASSATSRKSRKARLSRMMSRRSPCSPVAASVHFPAGPFGDLVQPHEHRAARRIVDVADQPVPPRPLER